MYPYITENTIKLKSLLHFKAFGHELLLLQGYAHEISWQWDHKKLKTHELYSEFGNVIIYLAIAIAMPTRKFCSVSEYQPAATGYPLKGPGPKRVPPVAQSQAYKNCIQLWCMSVYLVMD